MSDEPCTHRLADGPLACTRADQHEPGHGCVYQSTSGVPDAHTASSGE